MYMGSEKLLRQYLTIRREFENTSDHNALISIDKLIHEEKLGLRNRNRERELYADKWNWHQAGNEYNDRVWAKYIMPYELTETEIDEFIEEEWCHWYNPYDDGRDCTGVWFTSRIRCFVCNGKTIAYHFKSCDV